MDVCESFTSSVSPLLFAGGLCIMRFEGEVQTLFTHRRPNGYGLAANQFGFTIIPPIDFCQWAGV